MHTPSLRTRVVTAGALTVLGLLLGLDLLLYVTQRSNQLAVLESSIDAAEAVLRARAPVDPEEAVTLTPPGVQVAIRTPDGTTYGQPFEDGPALRREVRLPDGAVATLAADRGEVDRSLRRLLALEAFCTVLVTVLAATILRWISDVALRPLGHVVAAARRTAGGGRGERLRPDEPRTELGEMARAYDQMLDALEASERTSARLASIVESCDESIIGVNLDGRIFSWNRAAERIHGWGSHEMIGTDLLDVFTEEVRADLAEAFDAVRAGEAVRWRETRGLCRNDGTVELALTLSPVRETGADVRGVSVIARDVSLEHRMAEALHTTLANLEVALDEARGSETRTRRFLDDAAHQLRTPVAGIQACAESLLRATRAADRDRLLASLVAETSRVGRLITSLLTLARLDGDRHDIACAPCDVVALCREEADRLATMAPGLDITVAPAALSRPAVADENAVREVLGNLLDNARRHASAAVEIAVVENGSRVEVRVHNDGPPIPDDKVHSAFERFVSLDGAGGTGLGLPIARDLARACGGGLTYEDATFVLRLPTATRTVPPNGRSALARSAG